MKLEMWFLSHGEVVFCVPESEKSYSLRKSPTAKYQGLGKFIVVDDEGFERAEH